MLLLFIIPGCSAILSKAYGVKTLNKFDPQAYRHFLSNLKPGEISVKTLLSDSLSYKETIDLGDSIITKKDLYQPIHFIYFQNGNPVSFQANCYAKGTPTKLNWNYQNRFSVFPPLSAIPLENENKLFLKKFKEIYPALAKGKSKKYTVLVFWTLMIPKISHDAITTIFKNIEETHHVKETSVYLINTDNYYISLNNK